MVLMNFTSCILCKNAQVIQAYCCQAANLTVVDETASSELPIVFQYSLVINFSSLNDTGTAKLCDTIRILLSILAARNTISCVSTNSPFVDKSEINTCKVQMVKHTYILHYLGNTWFELKPLTHHSCFAPLDHNISLLLP